MMPDYASLFIPRAAATFGGKFATWQDEIGAVAAGSKSLSMFPLSQNLDDHGPLVRLALSMGLRVVQCAATAGHPDENCIYVVKSGNEWRIEALAVLAAARTLQHLKSTILGYTDAETEAFLEGRYREHATFRGITVHSILSSRQHQRALALGLHAFDDTAGDMVIFIHPTSGIVGPDAEGRMSKLDVLARVAIPIDMCQSMFDVRSEAVQSISLSSEAIRHLNVNLLSDVQLWKNGAWSRNTVHG